MKRSDEWKSNFSDAIIQFVNNESCEPCDSCEVAYKIIQKLTKTERRGIWNQISVILGATPSEARNYYHNTWIKQFYEDMCDHSQDFKKFVFDTWNKQPGWSVVKVVNQFCKSQPQINFCIRQLQQVAHAFRRTYEQQKAILQKAASIQKQQRQPDVKTENIDDSCQQAGFTASTQDCVIFLDCLNDRFEDC